ncbi:thiaminase II [Mesobacillus thioparans]|uniref:thiaminase II n=1 Tax=Mesobacillus thioparans TaxID=370439 RepID=UPI0039F0CA1A
MSTFTQMIRQEASAIWEANLHHPFVQGIAKGTLPIENFRYYVLQDSYYLSHFARIQAIAASRAEELSITAKMAAHAQGTYQAELSLHEGFMGQLGVTKEELQSFRPAPTAYAYTSHLYRVAASGSLGEIIAALLPCYWIYYEIGERMKHAAPGTPIYQEWIGAYGSDWFSELVNEQLSLLDSISESASEKEKEKMKQHFLYSCHYELKFWEMASTLEGWSINNNKTAVQ